MRYEFTTYQVARLCTVAPRTVVKWCDSGRIAGVWRIGPKNSGDRRIPREGLVAFLREVNHRRALAALDAEAAFRVLILSGEARYGDAVEAAAAAIDGAEVVRVGCPFEATACLTRCQPDLFVIDFQAAGRAGSLALAALAADSVRLVATRADVALFALVPEDESRLADVARRFTQVWKKPVDPAEVGAAVLLAARQKFGDRPTLLRLRA